MSNEVYIFGSSHEAINTAIFLANLDKIVHLYAKDGEIDETLLHYKFDRQMGLVWSLYNSKQRIILHHELDFVFAQKIEGQTIWLFLDNFNDDKLDLLAQKQTSPHTHIILSGTKKLARSMI